MKTNVLTLDATSAGDIELSDAIFGLDPRGDILYRVVQWQMNRRHDGSKRTLQRGEINRTTKKMYKQKGTGGARHGAMSAPQFRGGGKAMAPVLRSRVTDLPKKVRVLGVKMALSSKAKAGELIVLDAAKSADGKTMAMAAKLNKLGLTDAIIVDGPQIDAMFERASRNIPNLDLLNVAGLNVYDVLRRDKLVLTKSAVAAIEERFK
jgi:large subunit ribosomal protein L4